MKHRDVLKLYKSLLRESQKFSSYNYREYALQRIKDGFRENREIEDSNQIMNLYNKASESLETIKRQVLVGNLYSSSPLIIENNTEGNR